MKSFKPELIEPIGHSMVTSAVAFSPTGEFVLTGSVDGTAKLWNTRGQELSTFEGHLIQGGVTDVAFSPANDQIATCGYNKQVIIWNYLTGQQLLVFNRDRAENPHCLAFSGDGSQLLVGRAKGQMEIWDIPNPGEQTQTLTSFSRDLSDIHSEKITSVAFAANGSKIASAADGDVAITSIASGKRTIFISGEDILALDFSTGGNQVVTGNKAGSVKLWKASTGALVREFEAQHTEQINHLVYSQHGLVASAGKDRLVCIWEAKNGRAKYSPKQHEGTALAVDFSPDDQQLVSTSRGSAARLWNIKEDQATAQLQGHSAPLLAARFSRDGQAILAGSSKPFAFLWDLDEGQLASEVLPHTRSVRTVGYSPDGTLLLTGSEDEKAIVWDAITKQEKETFPHEGEIYALQITPDNKLLITAAKDGAVRVWDRSVPANPKYRLEHRQGTTRSRTQVRSLATSRNGQLILSGTNDKRILFWDTAQADAYGKVSPQLLYESNETVRALAISPDEKYFVSAAADNTIILWDLANQQQLKTFTGHQDDVYALTFSPDGHKVLSGSKDKKAILWDLEGKVLKEFGGHKSTVSTVDFSPVGRYFLTGSHDCNLRIWDSQAEEVKPLATLIQIDERDWVVTAANGLFDASPGAMKLMHYVVGQEVIDLNQLKERYWQPGLLNALLHYSQIEVRKVSPFDDVPLYPKVNALHLRKNSVLELEVQERNGGLGRISLRINGKEVEVDLCQLAAMSEADGAITYRLSLADAKYQKFMMEGENKVSIRCWNEEGWLPGPYHEVIYKKAKARARTADRSALAAAPASDVTFHTICIGTANYRNKDLSLRFPDQDARLLSRALNLVGKELFVDRVMPHLLTTEDPASDHYSSKEKIRQAFVQVANQAKAEDILLLYFSGHGANLSLNDGQKAQYYYLTEATISADLSDPAIRERSAVSSDELTDWIKEIPAAKQVVVFDTCYAGNALAGLTTSRSAVNATRERALERMKDRTGMYVLTGSAADRVSYEASNYGQGLLTYSLLLGMRGAALFSRTNQSEKTVDVITLFTHAREEVERLAKEFSVIQKPIVRAPDNIESFDIGLAPATVRKMIQIATPKPVFQRSDFMNEDNFLDDLDISTTLDQYLAGQIGITNRPQAIFIDVRNFPGAHNVRGLYRQTKEGVLLRGRVYKQQEELGAFELEAGSMEEIVPQIAYQVEQMTFPRDAEPEVSSEEIQLLERGRKEDLETLRGQPGYGYDPEFLGAGFEVPMPALSNEQAADIAHSSVDGEDALHYQYYSVIQSKSRRFPFFAACNFNGRAFKQIKRASTKFIGDRRIADEHQWEDDFYKHVIGTKSNGKNKYYTEIFDRGHMAKREDTQWGADLDIASRGAALTFYFTNALPQVSHLNGTVWRGLEDYIVHVATDGKKLTDDAVYNINIMTGPVFHDDDPELPIDNGEFAKIPVQFWKIVYFRRKTDAQLRYVGFMMGQKDLLDKALAKEGVSSRSLAARSVENPPFEGYKDNALYQVKVSLIESLTNLSFHPAEDPFAGSNGGNEVKEVVQRSVTDITGRAEGLGYGLQGISL